VKLSELLDELRANLLRDASTLKSGPPDTYWSDEALVRYIDEAHRRFARRSFCIRDFTTAEVVQLPLETDIALYRLHPAILRVQSGRVEGEAADLVRSTHPIQFSGNNPFTDSVEYDVSSSGGMPRRFSTDEGTDVEDEYQVCMFVDPRPTAKETGKLVNLRVIRLPLNKLTLEKTDAVPEIPEDWQLDMLEWAAYRALRNWDVDAEDRTKAEKHKERFEEAVKECLKEVQQRKMFQPQTWAFGQHGWGGYTRT
jgi:hypothetical protein